jgi:hypothetical protein
MGVDCTSVPFLPISSIAFWLDAESAAALAAIFNLLPISFPFFAPSEWPFADDADFFCQIRS